MNNSSVSLSKSSQAQLSSVEAAFWGTSYGVVSILIILTNTVALAAFVKTRPRRKNTHYFLMNLSIADLLVGAISVPLFVVCLVDLETCGQSLALRIVHSTFDILSGLSSVFTLAIVSVERLVAVSIPYKFRMIPRKAYFICIAATWFLSGCVASIGIAFYFRVVKESFYTVVILSLSLPLSVVSFAYVTIVYKINQKNNSAKNCKNMTVERRLSITLLCVTAIFVLSWLPFQLIFILVHFCKTCTFPANMVYFIKFLHYSNSFMNAAVYTFRIPEFKEALAELFNRKLSQSEGQHVLLQDFTCDSTTSVTRVTHSLVNSNGTMVVSPDVSPKVSGRMLKGRFV